MCADGEQGPLAGQVLQQCEDGALLAVGEGLPEIAAAAATAAASVLWLPQRWSWRGGGGVAGARKLPRGGAPQCGNLKLKMEMVRICRRRKYEQ